MEMLLHPAEKIGAHAPRRPRRLSTVGHAETLQALAAAARTARVRFMLIGGTYRDAFVRAGSTRDIDLVLADEMSLPDSAMKAAGFARKGGSTHAWERRVGSHVVLVEIAAIATPKGDAGPFSVAYRQAKLATVDGVRVRVPRIEDYIVLKLIAADAEQRRFTRDLTDVRDALESTAGSAVSISSLRARMRDLYGFPRDKLNRLVAILRLAG